MKRALLLLTALLLSGCASSLDTFVLENRLDKYAEQQRIDHAKLDSLTKYVKRNCNGPFGF
jgi:hypothetical protein